MGIIIELKIKAPSESLEDAAKKSARANYRKKIRPRISSKKSKRPRKNWHRLRRQRIFPRILNVNSGDLRRSSIITSSLNRNPIIWLLLWKAALAPILLPQVLHGNAQLPP